MALFPKQLPRAAVRKAIVEEKKKLGLKIAEEDKIPQVPASFEDMIVTFKRLFTNKIFMFNNLSASFYVFGYIPYWTFMAKYIETQYRQNASVSSMYTGTIGLIFSAIGILVAGVVITKWKPSARYMASWNIVVELLTAMGMITFIYLGCEANDNNFSTQSLDKFNFDIPCNDNCECDYVKYNPVCSQDGLTTFISACHAGCKEQIAFNGSKVFTDCSCISPNITSTIYKPNIDIIRNISMQSKTGGFAVPGSCSIDCSKQFFVFLVMVCFLKFIGATGRATNFLVAIRCVEENDKPVSMGFDMMMLAITAFIPAPIVFGYIIDNTCLVWGKTCSGTGNCWLYDGESLRYTLNMTASIFMLGGMLFDIAVWYYVKDLKIFDDEDIIMTDIKCTAEKVHVNYNENS